MQYRNFCIINQTISILLYFIYIFTLFSFSIWCGFLPSSSWFLCKPSTKWQSSGSSCVASILSDIVTCIDLFLFACGRRKYIFNLLRKRFRWTSLCRQFNNGKIYTPDTRRKYWRVLSYTQCHWGILTWGQKPKATIPMPYLYHLSSLPG